MNRVIATIKRSISECKKKGYMFNMPSLNRDDVKITAKELESKGSSLYRYEYQIDFASGDWIHIEYASKDKSRPFQNNPDRSIIEVTCSDSSLNFIDAWDEKSYHN